MYVLIRNLIIIGSTFTYEHLNEKNLNLYSIDAYMHNMHRYIHKEIFRQRKRSPY